MRMKKWLMIIFSGLLMFSTIPFTAVSADDTDAQKSDSKSDTGKYSTKDEVIYGNLDVNGNVKDMYVVNNFNVTEPGLLVDYGDYSHVRNLTDLSDIEQMNHDEVHFQADETNFYYQGNLGNKPLPWNISISYIVNGEKVKPEELAGISGDLEIQITTSANENVDPTFFENYLIQISLTLDPLIFNDVQAPEGTEVNEGKNKQISFMVLPDQEEELILSANVTELEMDPIEISAIPANIAIEDPDISNMTGDMESLSSAINDINTGVGKLNNGIAELNTGAGELSRGSTEYRQGLNELNQSSGDLVNGSKEIRNVLNQVNDAMQNNTDIPELGDLQDLPDGFRELAKGIRESADGLGELKENYNQAFEALDDAIGDIPDYNLTDTEIEELYASGGDKEVIDKLIETYKAAKKVNATYKQTKEGFKAVSSALKQAINPLNEMANELENIADSMEANTEDLEKLDALTELQEGISSMATEYNTFHDGLIDYTEGVNSMTTNYQKLDSGIQELSEGTSALESGASDLHEGTKELQGETNDLPDEMQSKIDELMEEYENKDFDPVSFVSDKNDKVDVVQFVLQTEKIEIEEPETDDSEEDEEKSLWQRFLDLFK